MMRFQRFAAVLALAVLIAPMVVRAEESPRNEEERLLDETEDNVIQVQRQLFAARQSNDTKEISRLEKKFKKLQKERVRLLRATWQM